MLALREAEKGPVARRHLADSLGRWREELTPGDSTFMWWWGTETGERAASQEVKRWAAGQAGGSREDCERRIKEGRTRPEGTPTSPAAA